MSQFANLGEYLLIEIMQKFDHDTNLRLWKAGASKFLMNPNGEVWQQLLSEQYPKIKPEPDETFRSAYIWAQAKTRIEQINKGTIQQTIYNAILRNWPDVIEYYLVKRPDDYYDGIRIQSILKSYEFSMEQYAILAALVKIISGRRNQEQGYVLLDLTTKKSFLDDRLLSRLNLTKKELKALPFLYNALSAGIVMMSSPFPNLGMNPNMLDTIKRMIQLYPALLLYDDGDTPDIRNASAFWLACTNFRNLGLDIIDSILKAYPELINDRVFKKRKSAWIYTITDYGLDYNLITHLKTNYSNIMDPELKVALGINV